MGTRPEAIKLAPVVTALRGRAEVHVLATAQHRSLLDQVLRSFAIRPDSDLNLMRPDQSLDGLTARAVVGVGSVLDRVNPAIVVVQGDTTTAFVAALAAFYRRIPVAHVEAGLRTDDRYAPFPEEMNRRLVTSLAELHFAPTRVARSNLLAEGVPSNRIAVTGNTVVDALRSLVGSGGLSEPAVLRRVPSAARLVLVTAHRRESQGAGLAGICAGIRRIVDAHADTVVVYPVHPNPNVSRPVRRLLGRVKRVVLCKPLEYPEFVALLARAFLVLTDSGGIQEEAPALGKPTLVLRDKTERPEAVAAGAARIVGTNPVRIALEAGRLLGSPAAYARMARVRNPFGDGRAGVRIASALCRWLDLLP
jgi:UDP-N-acetylglucosamine 2-epimerase (non-hydrolysing)